MSDDDVDLTKFFDAEKLQRNVIKTICYYMDFSEDDDGIQCGAYAEYRVPMPDPVPDFPVCARHREQALGNFEDDGDTKLLVLGYLHESGVDLNDLSE